MHCQQNEGVLLWQRFAHSRWSLIWYIISGSNFFFLLLEQCKIIRWCLVFSGYTVHHRGRAGEWVEVGVGPGVGWAVVRGLPCGAPHHLYLTAWNSQGTSPPSPVLVASTLGSREYCTFCTSTTANSTPHYTQYSNIVRLRVHLDCILSPLCSCGSWSPQTSIFTLDENSWK